MKTDYRVVRDFWRNGNLVPAGEIVSLTARQAKYLSHVLELPAQAEVTAEPVPAEEPAAEPVAEPAPAERADPVTFDLKPAKKARKAHGDDN